MNRRNWFGKKTLAAVPDSAPQPAVAGHAPPAARDANAELEMQAGLAAAGAGNHAEAVVRFERALEIAPDLAIAHRELACAHLELGDLAAAADSLELAAHFSTGDARTCFLQGLCAQRGGETDAAVQHYRRALELEPALAEAYNNLGYLLLNELDSVGEAKRLFEAALQTRPGYIDARLNLGLARLHAGEREAAIAEFDAVLRLDAGNAEARLNRAIARLALRRWSDEKNSAWDEYEARKAAGPYWIPRPYAFPEWDGSAAPGKTLLIYGEQGLGDEIMFASCVVEAQARVGHSIVECAPKLAPLFARSFEACDVVGLRQGEPADWLSSARPVDMQIAVGSLPRLFRRTGAAFPAPPGYLRADPGRIEAWRERLDSLGLRPKIALSWRGGTRHTRAARRSIPVAQLASMLRSVPAEFVSLQYDGTDEDIALFKESGLNLHQWPQAIADYEETAALLCGVDLVLSVCTALIHLGGALGRPVWVMVPAHPEWRYGESGEDMPWYPSVRLLRQDAAGDWGPLLARLGIELDAWAAGRPSRTP